MRGLAYDQGYEDGRKDYDRLKAAVEKMEEALAYCGAYFEGRLDPLHNHPNVKVMEALAQWKDFREAVKP